MAALIPRAPLNGIVVAVVVGGCAVEGSIVETGNFLVPLRQAESRLSLHDDPPLCFLNSKWLTNIRKRELCIE